MPNLARPPNWGHHFAHRNGYALSEQHCWYHPKDLIQNSGSPTKRLFWDHWYERRTLLSWFMFSSCMNLIVRSLFGKLLFRILKIESCLHVDTLGVLVWFKCVRIYEYRYMYTYHHLQVWVPSLKKNLRDGEKSHPVTEPCKAPRLEGAGIYWCYTIYVQTPWTLEVQDHGMNRLLKLLIENILIRKPWRLIDFLMPCFLKLVHQLIIRKPSF